MHEGRLDDARMPLEEAIASATGGSDGHLAAWCKKDLGWVALEQGAYPEARSLLKNALQVGEEFGDRNLLAYSLEGLSSLAAALGQHERAVCLAGACAALRESLGNPLPPSWQRMFHRRLDVSRGDHVVGLVAGTCTALGAGTSIADEQPSRMVTVRDVTARPGMVSGVLVNHSQKLHLGKILGRVYGCHLFHRRPQRR